MPETEGSMAMEGSIKTEQPTSRPKYGGGPMGLGDPDDYNLRRVEKDVLVMKKVRDRTKEEKCNQEVAEFTKCCKDSGLKMVWTCRKENSDLQACLTKWYHNEDFVKECTQQYLKERSEYRRTGIRVTETEGSTRWPSA